MSEETNPQGTDADIASRLAAVEQDDTASAQPETPEQGEVAESEEVMPASQEQEEVTESEQEENVPPKEEEPTLPEDANPRTKEAFQRLTESNRQLKDKVDTLTKKVPEGNSVFDSIYGAEPADMPLGYENVVDANNYQNLDQNQVNDIASQFIQEDPTTGERIVDVERLVHTLNQANQQAVAQADARARRHIERYEQTRQVDEAHREHPYLDPKSENFDPAFFDLVRLKVLDNRVQGGSKTLSQLAQDALQVYQPRQDVAKERQQAVEQYKQTQQVRKQAQPVNRGKGADRTNTQHDYEALRARTQSANNHDADDAIIQRLKRAE